VASPSGPTFHAVACVIARTGQRLAVPALLLSVTGYIGAGPTINYRRFTFFFNKALSAL
jgi:hypothetical protein